MKPDLPRSTDTFTTTSSSETKRFRGWPGIDTVLLDMDGTLLDLRFDNYFWLEAVPARYAQRHGMDRERAAAMLEPMFAAKHGTLDWYCTDYWSRTLELDIAAMKYELRETVAYLPGAERFLQALKTSDLDVALVTNAHPDALKVKSDQTTLLQYVNVAISSHGYGVPKEHPDFWPRLQTDLEFNPARVLFVDDSLAVLRAARCYGIGHIIAIAHPDTGQDRRVVEEFPSVHQVIELLEVDVLQADSTLK